MTATSGDYWHRQIPWNAVSGSNADAPNGVPSTFAYQITTWCLTCHTRLNAPGGSASASSGDSIFNFRHSVTMTSGSHDPACTQCHLAHGTNAAMTGFAGVGFEIVPGMPSTITTNADSFLLKVNNRGTCQLCHDPTGTTTQGTIIGPPAPIAP